MPSALTKEKCGLLRALQPPSFLAFLISADGQKNMWVVVNTVVLFWGTLNIRCRIIIRTQKGDPNIDNYPCDVLWLKAALWVLSDHGSLRPF